MPYALNEYEKQLASMGIIVATVAGRSWRCWMCDKGSLVLTRLLAGAKLSPAAFVCDACGDHIGIYPDKGGGVQPALKGMKKTATQGTPPPDGERMDGRWR